ncbi:hypothetical protein NP493_664g02050 [Ridgeia piscesae]|uniref:Uncharacterized protein n=1 Tax=Ridgeia piscesae TaxID=27915 RepID=A0AAD9NR46_RIDPI|nr:hypothetical protein NP493_664g02050 [Ridgeia piscesae]
MANASNIGLDLGRTELEQYRQFTKMYSGTPRRITEKGYSYQVRLIGNRPTTEGIFVRIDERYRNQSTNGGSTFVVTSESYGLLLCPYTDMFNGSYFVWCPPIVLGERKTITVKLQYVDFNAFRIQRLKSLGTVIWEFDIRLDRRPITLKPLNLPKVTSVLKNYMNKQDVVEWYQEEERWMVQLASKERFFTPEISDMCKCVKRMHRLVLVGCYHFSRVHNDSAA